MALPFKVMPARANLAENAEGRLTVIGTSVAVSWTSSDPAVVQVDANGAIKALARGSATITATDGSKTSSATIKVWRTEGASTDASSESLIVAALAAGTISAEQALLYRVYARYGDDRLPAAYEGPADPQGGFSMQTVAAQMSALSQATQDLLRPFFIPPIYAESWYGRQLGLATVQAALRAGVRATANQPRICSREVADALIRHGLLIRRTTAQYNFYSFPTAFGNEAATLDYAASVIEQIDSSLRTLLERSPKGDAAEPCNGGDGALDIYFVELGIPHEYGQTKGYGRCENTPAFIEVDQLKVGGSLAAETRQSNIRTVLAHEVMHLFQFGMKRAAACTDYIWIDEGTAQWAPDYVFPSDNREDGFHEPSIPQRTGPYYVDYLKGGHRESIEKANGYSTYIYFQFMARKYGAPAIKALFDAWIGHGSVNSLDVALKAVGSSMKDAWPEFGKALWNDVRDNVLTDLRGWDNYDYGMANIVSRDPRPLTAGRLTVDLLQANGGKIAPRSLAYERLVFTDQVSPIFLINPLGSLPQAEHLKLTAVKKIGGQWREPEDWTADGTKYFCRDRVSERIEELLLIVSNSDPDPNATPAVLPTDVPFMLSASNVGCWKWVGQATQQTISDDGNIRSTNTARAVDLVFEPPSDFAGGPMLLSVTAGSANGLLTLSSTLPPCNGSITGPTKTVAGAGTVAAIGFNLDLRDLLSTTPDRKVGLLSGTTFIDSTQVMTCNGTTTTTAAPSTGWPWLLFPTTTNPLDVSTDGRRVEANVTINVPPFARTVHNFSFTAMRE